jgi:hypothetical protein
MSFQAFSDPFVLKKSNVPDEGETDVVAALEKELRSEKKQEIETKQSQILGSSGLELPDMPGQNLYLKEKAEKYAMVDNVPEGAGTRSSLGDFSFILDMQTMAANQQSSYASNQLMAMAYATLASDAQTGAQKIVESQFAYDLTAATFGLHDREKKAISQAKKSNKMANNAMYY